MKIIGVPKHFHPTVAAMQSSFTVESDFVNGAIKPYQE